MPAPSYVSTSVIDRVIVYFGGPIYTMNGSSAIAEAIAIRGGKILAVGTRAAVAAAAGESAKQIDLNGKALLPGFIDGHSHFPITGLYEIGRVNLNVPPLGRVTSVTDLLQLLREKAKATPPGEWVIGYNYNDLAMREGRHPVRTELDTVSTQHPVFILHVSGHLAACNSKALEMAGIDENRKDPEGGRFRRGADNKLAGVLEGPPAHLLVSALLPAPTEEQYIAAIRRDNAGYAKAGVTMAQNGGFPTIDAVFLKAAQNGDLTIRVVVWVNGRNAELLQSYGNKRSGAALDDKGQVILGAAKLFADGSPQGYTAYFSQPYFRQLPGNPPDYRGFPVFDSKDALFALVKELHDSNWQIATHTNGDQAIQDLLDAYGAAITTNPRKGHRHVLNHCQFARPDQVPQIAKYELVPSYFVTHTFFWGDIHRERVAGPERAAHISPLKASLDHKIPFALHNDTPITPISPLMSVFSAVNRLTMSGQILGSDQRISVMDALRAITINAAYMHFMEDRLGSLEAGKLADLVILEEDPVTIDPVKIKDIKILETIVGGETVYKA